MEERIGFRLDRLRLGEWIIGVASLALLVDLLVLPWYSLRASFSTTSAQFGAATSATGAQAHHLIGPFAIICALLGLAVWGTQAMSRGPALPLALTAIASVLSIILVVCLLVRVVFDPPAILVLGAPGVNTIKTDVAAVVGLFLAVLMFTGAWLSLRKDGIAEADAPRRIETLRLAAKRSA
jgi:hypothetical protein